MSKAKEQNKKRPKGEGAGPTQSSDGSVIGPGSQIGHFHIEKELGQPIGSGYPSDPKTIGFLKSWYQKHGRMPPHTRTSWKTVGRLINELSMKGLDTFDEG